MSFCYQLNSFLKLFLSKHEPLQVLPSPQPALLVETIRILRKDYVNLLVDKLRAPDGSYETGVVMPGVVPTQPPGINMMNNLEMNNPLSLHNEAIIIYLQWRA